MTIHLILLAAMLLAALWTVIGRSLLKATIGLAVTSAVITILMFLLDSPLAAVFELSVCTGLITVVFVSTISLTKPLTHKEITELSKNRMRRFWPLPIIVVGAAALLIFFFYNRPADLATGAAPAAADDVRKVLWNFRQLDMFAQIIIIIAGALGVAILFEERRRDEW